MRWGRLILVTSLLVTACQSEDADPQQALDDEWGMEGALSPTPPPGKEDSQNRKGLLVNTDTSRTQVWTARNKWEDTDTTAAKKAGLAWGANSGLTWDQKYDAWIRSLPYTTSADGYYQTFTLTTPWGKTLTSPSLECAETSIFLRITFAAWYELPWFMETVDGTGKRVYFGHNGVRTSSGRYASSPEFAIKYKDYTASAPQTWPQDSVLRGKHVAGGDDSQPALANAGLGAYLDEIHLNKRAGYFTIMALDYLGSMNLADAANTYNIVPDTVRPGDMLLERWQKNGIGHTLVVKEVTAIGEGNLDVTLISGSMPRRQGKKESGVAAKSYFTSDYTGGQGTNYDGDEYAKLGGGAKRWRVTKNVGGYWTNTWMSADEASWINSTDYAAIAARPARFGQILGQVSPEQQKTELLAEIEDSRAHLRQYPASCSARERREQAFRDLYDLSARTWGTSRAAIDAQYRVADDYVFEELVYSQSKTCCWDSSTAAMYGVVMDYEKDEVARAAQQGTCVAPTVFRSETSGYDRWAQYATSTGRGSAWKAWTEDESCPQRAVAQDTVATTPDTAFCSLGSGSGGCTDAQEPNDSSGAAKSVGVGTINGLKICGGDEDWFVVSGSRTVKITFTSSAGDLDLAAYDASGAQLAISQGTGDSESVTVAAGARIRVYGYNGATNTYALAVQ
ncbi:MAG TPA: hypothetical protein VL463_31085 [Kofleriaceae bacterium]|nr:hypothetical protein [Kofleriaceae bacterium]